jgi:glycosyltransferase involved in cell wall biosynthesis
MRVLCLTTGSQVRASTFFRIVQYRERLKELGIQVTVEPAKTFREWKSTAEYDTVLIQKALIRAGRVRTIRRNSKRLIYDVDDAIWHPHGKKTFIIRKLREAYRFKQAVRSADLCTAANQVLAAHLQTINPRVSVIPMALDEKQWTFAAKTPRANGLRIGWSGHPVNFGSIQRLEPVLAQIQREFPHVEYAIYSGEKPQLPSLRFDHVAFNPGSEAEAVRTFDIGLLPLPDDEFSRGKSPIKALQYLASGAAIVASPVGATKEFFVEKDTALFVNSPDDWLAALRKLIMDPKMRAELTMRGRSMFEQNFSVAKLTPRLAAALTGTLSD